MYENWFFTKLCTYKEQMKCVFLGFFVKKCANLTLTFENGINNPNPISEQKTRWSLSSGTAAKNFILQSPEVSQ